MNTKVVILDCGLQSRSSHSYALNMAIASRLCQLAIPFRTFGARSVEADVRADTGCEPFFTEGMYGSVRPPRIERGLRKLGSYLVDITDPQLPSETRTSRVLNARFEADLAALPRSVWERDSIVLFPGLMQHQLLGLARFLASRRDDITARIICQLMFEDSWLPWGACATIGEPTYREAFRIMRARCANVYFTVENEFLARKYAEKFGIEVDILPIPLSVPEAERHRSGTIRIGFLGYAKSERGFHLLPEAIAASTRARGDLEFVVQSNHGNADPRIVRAEAALADHPRIRLLRGQLSRDEYSGVFSTLDVLLLPYDPAHFGMRGSGVFAEAASGGYVVVASKRTWAGHCVERGEAAGETFDPYDAEALATAILSACRDLPRHKAAARARSGAWARRNSPAAYVDKIMSLGRAPLGSNGAASAFTRSAAL